MSCERILAENLILDSGATQTVSSEESNFPASNLIDFQRRTRKLRFTGCSSEWVKWDFLSATNPDAIVIIGERNGSIQISPMATITLQGNETDVWTGPSYEQTLTWDEFAIIHASDGGLHTEGLRFWRLLIADPLNPLGYIEINKVYLGYSYSSSRGAVQFPFADRHIDTSVIKVSDGGQYYARKKQQSMGFRLVWNALTVTEKERLQSFFESLGTNSAFFVQLDKGTVFSSTENKYTRYVRFESPPIFNLSSPGNFGASMAITEVL